MDVTDSRWTTVREEFARIQESPAASRPELLAALGDDLRAEVASLLAAMERAPSFLRLPEETDVRPGTVLGPYRLVEEIGRGGMGVVYRAERIDGEFSRQVAIKIAGGRMFGPEAERRFIQERQILAGLDHPHIVRLLDGGIAAGWRYFVMELAAGTPITDHCASRTLTLRDRLELFRSVCGAIHYAHQRLILHRDLKPGNIIVTADAGVKVLDFGIAQLLHAELAVAGAATTMHPFSLSCASPEQLRGEPLSLASDIYSLGVLLYELVAGTNPQHRPGGTFEDTYRRVVNEGVQAPSTVSPGIPHDLDAIVLKAIAQQPADRYASVSELQADIDRWLEGRPILARAPGALYVFGKLVRRQKGLTAMTATLAVLIAAGATVFVRQARIEQRRFEDARRLINTVVQEIQPKLESIPATLPLRQTLIERTMSYLESVSQDVGNNVELLLELANAYSQLARVQGDVTTSTLGNQSAAAERFRKADALMQRAASIAPSNPAVLKDAALFYGRLASFENTQGRVADSVAHAKLAVEYGERNQAARPGEFDAREVLSFAVFNLAIATPPDQWDVRVAMFQRAGDLYRALAADRPDKDNLARNVAFSDRFLASLHNDRGRTADARQFGERALAASERRLAGRPDDPTLRLDVVSDAAMLGSILNSSHDLDAAVERLRLAIALDEAILTADPANARARLLLADAERYLARNRLLARDTNGARRAARRSLELFESFRENGQFPSAVHWRFATAMATLADIEATDGHERLACDAYRQAANAFDGASRQTLLVDLAKADADRTRARRDTCAL